MSSSISPTQSSSALPQRRSRQASSSAFSPTGSYIARDDLPRGASAGMSAYGSPSIGQGLPSRRQYDSIAMSMRQVSSASISVAGTGTSTPDYKRRARRMVERGIIKENEVDRDWGNVEPDEVFRRLPVGEVRKVEAKMRTDALGKQAELRAMVGTRYRDLLTSATQITALHNSSIRLSRQLRNIADISSNPDTIAITAETSTDVSDTDDILARLPAAAHMKLLLDATEALYVYLGNHEYLRAAYLWLVARVTKECLSRMKDEFGATYQPLLQKQWEVLLPFRSQVVQQATESLRTRDASDIKSLSETILAIILLDNVAVPDALAILLEQRTTALRSMLAHTSHPATTGIRRRSNSRASRTGKEHIVSTLGTAVRTLLSTVSSVQSIFSKSDAESLIERLIRLVQIDSSMPTITAPAPLRRSSSNTSATHHRRASRLVSISLPQKGSGSGGEEPPVSTTDIISSLPSAQILLRHLPPAVLTYTPFLTPPTDAQVDLKLERWAGEAIEVLKEAAPMWLVDLTSVQAVWEVRTAMVVLLESEEGGEGRVMEKRIADTLEAQCVERIKDVWRADLGGIVRSTSVEVEGAVKAIVERGTEADLDPERHLFTDIAFPSITSTLNTPSVSVPSFVAALKKRSAYRTPILDEALSTLESAAASIKADRSDLPESICEAYVSMTITALEELVQALQVQLETAGRVQGDKRLYGELLVGRVALFLATTSPMLGDLLYTVDVSKTTAQLLSLHTASLRTWQSTSIASAISHLSPLFASSRPDEVDDQWQAPLPLGPSAQLMHSLYSLAGATRALGIPPGVNRPVVRDLVEQYGEQVAALEGWTELRGTKAVQGVVDMGWVNTILGKEAGEGSVQSLLDQTPNHMRDSISQSLDIIIADSLRRTQLLLQPILVLVSPDLAVFSAPVDTLQRQTQTQRGGGAKWLRFGPPASQLAFPKLPLLEDEMPNAEHAAEAADGADVNGAAHEANGADGSGAAAGEADAAHRTDGAQEERGPAQAEFAARSTKFKSQRPAIREISDFRSPIAVAKPGKRFNLLSITS